jgi:hypothetical protein
LVAIEGFRCELNDGFACRCFCGFCIRSVHTGDGERSIAHTLWFL